MKELNRAVAAIKRCSNELSYERAHDRLIGAILRKIDMEGSNIDQVVDYVCNKLEFDPDRKEFLRDCVCAEL